MESPLPASPLRGRLLVANPLLEDPNFSRTVVLVLAHGGEGALGVVLNRPSDAVVADVLPRWSEAASPPRVLYAGGPVNRRAVIGLARREAGMGGTGATGGQGAGVPEPGVPEAGVPEAGVPEAGEGRPAGEGRGWTPVGEGIGTVDLELDPGQVAGELAGVRIFVGYAGWSSGQLEGEIAGGSWWVLDAVPGDVFGNRPEQLWRDVLRRQRPPLAFVSNFPPDLEMN